MKKKLSIWALFILTIVMIVSAFIPAASPVQAADDSLAKIKEKGTLVVATSPDYPPYEFLVNKKGKSQVQGIDIMVAKKIAKDIGVKLVVKKMSFDSLLVALQTGKCDMVIGGVNPTPTRRKNVDFSKMYYHGGQYILIKKSNELFYHNKSSFTNKSIGAQTGTTQYSLAKKQIPGVKMKGMTSYSDLVLALKTNKVNGVVMEKPTALAYEKNDSSLKAINADFKLDKGTTGVAIAFAKGSTSLVNAANKSIDQINKQDLVNKVYIPKAGKYMKVNTQDTSMMHYWRFFALGVGYTLIISGVSVIFGILLGLLFALMKLSKNKVAHAIATAYIEFLRGTPMMVQVLFVYFGIGAVINIPALLAGIIAVSLNSGAYVAEIIRGGINSVDPGQTEAAESLGLPHADVMRFVVLPQAMRNIWPALGNEFITLLKDSSIVSIIGVTDLIYEANLVRSDTYRGVMPIFIAMLLYFAMTWVLTRVLNHFERKMQHGK
ncbi:polar amino acid ABC transporter inner membrane subunit [Lactobacillus selangorensis]|uniref:Polar amino acid ABC transporter inner membrane subunit n=1 Tax=Lactobacillus selangorensis TaxID=81857 RepID=A0A0R2FSK6_9LACO|nr:ABC transporter substrate-binding protein/permease [Lactobacillus selangorensis]KRN27926.1 polar amino acid ABC transporter inner membrane subunit [Lactobacillus selangorensis]KRN30603.1 polar amino acid ABC transporter inner membrane subunit [Lactobacillus selangorensis]